MTTTSSATTWIKLAARHGTQQIININAHEFILIPSKLSTNIVFKYNSLTNSFHEYIKDSNLEIDCHTVIKAAFNEKKQTIYLRDGSNIYSFDVTTNIQNTFQLQNSISRGCYFLFVNNHLHFIGNHDGHWIRSIHNNTFNIVSDSTKEYIYHRESGAAIYISSKQCILLIGGYSTSDFNFLSDIWIYSLQTQKWSKINNISFKRYQFGYVLTSNQRYIILFGGWKYGVDDSDEEVNDICVLDVKDDNNWKLKQCKIKCPDMGSCYGARTGGMNSNNILINGFIKKCFQLKEFSELELPPACIVSVIGKYFSAEMIHYIDNANKHYGIYLKDILLSLYE